MANPLPSKKNIRDISGLFISNSASADRKQLGPTPVDSASPNQADATPLLVIRAGDDPQQALYFSISFCRWLLAAFRHVTFVSERPPAEAWGPLADQYLLEEKRESGRTDSSARYSLQKNLDLVFANSISEEIDGLRAAPSKAEASLSWAACESPSSLPDQVIVVADCEAARGTLATQPALRVELLPPRIEAFIRYFKRLKAGKSDDSKGQAYVVLDRSGAEEDLTRIAEAWHSLTDHFLGQSVPILGQIDSRRMSDAQVPLTRRLRLCEEALGPPWPSDLRAQCEIATEKEPKARLAREINASLFLPQPGAAAERQAFHS